MRNSWVVGISVAVVCVFCRSAVAEELFRYNYVELGYGKATADMEGSAQKIDGSVYGIVGSYAVHELVAIGVVYQKSKASFNGSVFGTPVSLTGKGSSLIIGVTLHKMVSDNTELGLDLSRDQSSYDAMLVTIGGSTSTEPASTNNTNVFRVRGRTAIVSEFRLLASVGRTTGGKYDASTDYSIGAEYELGKDFSLGAEYDLSNDPISNTSGFIVSGRYYY